MNKSLLLIPLLLLLPAVAGAATVATTSSTTENAYLAAGDVSVTNPQPADLITAGATVSIDAPVKGDVLAAGGTLVVAQGAGGDVRVAGGKVTVKGTVVGDVAAAGGSVQILGTARSIYAAGAAVDVEGGSSGDVTIYGADVTLAGEYGGNVSVVASDHFELGEGTHIKGALKYSAPEQLSMPESVQVDGGARYTGTYAYVPTNEQVHQYALVGAGVFFIVRVLAGSIVAGLILGLFPMPSTRISDMALSRRPRKLLRYGLIGLAAVVITPIASILLFVSFVGAGLALLLILLYALLILLSYAFCGIALGIYLRRTVLYRAYGAHDPLWQDAVLGTFLVHLIGLVPFVGGTLVIILALLCAGALCVFTYRSVFGRYNTRI